MPNRNGTGPEGKGPQTGQKKGKCNDAKEGEGLGPCGKGLKKGLGRRFTN